mgnify:CR=1 FL=1
MWTRRTTLNPTLSLPGPLQGRPLLWLLLAMTAGILLAHWLRPGLNLALALLILSGVLAAYCLFRNAKPLPALLLSAALLGLYLCAGQQAALDAWPCADAEQVTLEGRVMGAAVPKEDGTYRLLLQVESLNNQALATAPVYVYAEGALPRAGSRIQVQGECFQPRLPGNPQAFDYQTYLSYQGIAGSVSAYYGGEVLLLEAGPRFSLGQLGAWFRQKLLIAAIGMDPTRKALALGVFLGDKAGLDYRMSNTLGLAGMLHAFAVSGLNVGFIVAFALLLLGGGYRKRKARLAVILALLLLYIAMTGAAASIVRAALMALTLLLAQALDEPGDGVSALAFSALIILAFKPLWLLDPGFQLSYAAVLGILIYYPAFQKLLRSWPRLLRDSYAVTWAATLFTLPLVSYYFWHISWLGWLPAPLVAWGVGAAVLLGFGGAVLAMFWPYAASLLLSVAGWLMELLYRLAQQLLRWPGAASVSGALPLWPVALILALLLALPLIKCLGQGKRLIFALLLSVLCFSLFPILSHWPALAWERETLAKAVFLDVGQGDACLVQTRDGYTVLIDGGGSKSSGAVGEYILLPYLKSQGISSIDLIVSSHPDQDHLDGLISALENLPARTLLTGDCWPEAGPQGTLLQAARSNGTKTVFTAAGDNYTLGRYLRLTVYNPAPEDWATVGEGNNCSLVCELSCGDTDILFTGDAAGSVAGKQDKIGRAHV